MDVSVFRTSISLRQLEIWLELPAFWKKILVGPELRLYEESDRSWTPGMSDSEISWIQVCDKNDTNFATFL